ncbi:MAG: 30S ribosomal protein S8 [Candidatus Moranbacteria bacterium]|nr:30S ribosomal protein S8 [Candidatus Moranbacteria bacterium]
MDPISDMLTRIRNAYARGKKTTLVPHSKFKHAVLLALVKYGYLRKLETSEEETSPDGKSGREGKKTIKVFLKYQDGKPAAQVLKRISKPGQRIYSGSNKVGRFSSRRALVLVSTSKGILPHWEAKKQKAGGEVLCVVY